MDETRSRVSLWEWELEMGAGNDKVIGAGMSRTWQSKLLDIIITVAVKTINDVNRS